MFMSHVRGIIVAIFDGSFIYARPVGIGTFVISPPKE